jgi:hypothetical protein
MAVGPVVLRRRSIVLLLLHFCNTFLTLLLHCCYTSITLLLYCFHTLVELLSHCCYTVVSLLLHCCYTVVTLLLHLSYIVVTLLTHEGLAAAPLRGLSSRDPIQTYSTLTYCIQQKRSDSDLVYLDLLYTAEEILFRLILP